MILYISFNLLSMVYNYLLSNTNSYRTTAILLSNRGLINKTIEKKKNSHTYQHNMNLNIKNYHCNIRL